MTDSELAQVMDWLREGISCTECAARLHRGTRHWVATSLAYAGTSAKALAPKKTTIHNKMVKEQEILDPSVDEWPVRVAALTGARNPRWMKCIINSKTGKRWK